MCPVKHTYWSNNKYKCSYEKAFGRILKFHVCFSPLFWIIIIKKNLFFFVDMFPQGDCSASAKHTLCDRKDKQIELCTWSRTRDPTFKTLIIKATENLTWLNIAVAWLLLHVRLNTRPIYSYLTLVPGTVMELLHSICRATRLSGPINMSSWKPGPTWGTWSSTTWSLSGWGKSCGCC